MDRRPLGGDLRKGRGAGEGKGKERERGKVGIENKVL